jgi:type II secretory pathway pseudopilin PulG
MIKKYKDNQSGFTILEFMIANTVFATILLIATVAMIGIGNLYYKGFNQSRVQDDTRNIINQFSEDVQLQSTPPNTVSLYNIDLGIISSNYSGDEIKAICIGNVRYSYVENLQIGREGPNGTPPQIENVLWRDTLASSSTPCKPLPLQYTTPEDYVSSSQQGSNGQELVAPGNRLTSFGFTQISGGYELSVGLAYGNPILSPNNTSCKLSTADRFCAADELNNFVVRRSQ